ncbi:SixA phosphatase family protein [Algibacter sp.]|uniref:SixA phosphatase family protein n=1 Tax=Algibacter sp. TaxID=1872428 RepID=UPI003C7866FA
MKKLILVRHAKSSWEYDVTDHERPLKSRGYKDADIVSKALKGRLKPDLVISSDAARTKETSDIFVSNLNINTDIVTYNHDLYDFSGANLLQVIKSCDNIINTLMIFGHNHALTAFVNTYGDTYIDNVPTSGVVIIEFDINQWHDLKPGKTLTTLFPRDLKS